MKEEFRKWNYRGNLAVKYTDNTGAKSVWQKNQEELLHQIEMIVGEYQNQNIKLTNRQLYYQLVAGGIIPNADEIYKRICKFLTDCRYAGLVDWDAIEDRGRTPEKHPEWEDVNDMIKSAIYSYRLPRWQDQEYYVELYSEKQAMESILKPIADKYHIYFGYNKGYSSASTMYDLAKRVKDKIDDKKQVIILYLGDHDPSGLDMVRDIKERIEEFLTDGQEYTEPNFEVIQLALNMEQIKKYNPPPNPAKITDPRATGYIMTHGDKSWELDALKPEVLMAIAEHGIQEHLDIALYNKWIKMEEQHKKALIKFGTEFSKKK